MDDGLWAEDHVQSHGKIGLCFGPTPIPGLIWMTVSPEGLDRDIA